MKVGDWVVHEDGRVGQITLLDFNRCYHLVMYDNTFARMTDPKHLTVVAPPVADILTAVNTNERE
jgi:hypothetical protein